MSILPQEALFKSYKILNTSIIAYQKGFLTVFNKACGYTRHVCGINSIVILFSKIGRAWVVKNAIC